MWGRIERAGKKSKLRGLYMFGKQVNKNSLAVPPIAEKSSEAVEVLRVWAAPGEQQQLTLRTTWKDAGAWGLLLVDVARHAAKAYEREGEDPQEILKRIQDYWDAEWTEPTDEPADITDSR
jgi:hypothetical protein